MALAIVAARLLGPVEFGHYSYAFAIGFLLGELADLGLHFFIARQVAEDPTASIGAFVRAKMVLVLSQGAAGFLIGMAFAFVVAREVRSIWSRYVCVAP